MALWFKQRSTATLMDPLSQLNDIVELEHVSAWPLAWGWWLALALLLILVISTIFAIIKARKHSALLRASRKTIAQCQSMADISTQLKIVALHYFSQPQQSIEPLSGHAWLQFLNQQLPEKQQISNTELTNISTAMYTKNNHQQFSSYLNLATLWLHKAPILRGQADLSNENKKGHRHV